MKQKMTIILLLIGLFNFFTALVISIIGIINNSYFNDFNNYKSLKNPQTYMEIDTLILKRGYDYTYTNNSPKTFIVYGKLQKHNTEIKMVVGNAEYLDYNLNKFPVFTSKLTNDHFLKNAPNGYYKKQFRSFIMTMYLKLSLFPLIGLIIYIYNKYRNSI